MPGNEITIRSHTSGEKRINKDMSLREETPGYEIEHSPRGGGDRQVEPSSWRESQRACVECRISRRDFLISTGASAALVLGGISLARAQERPAEKVGFIMPEHGPHSSEARSLITGFELFLKEKGSEAPRIQIVKKDSGPDDEKTLEALADLLMNQEVRVLVGPPTLKGSEQTIHGVGGGNAILFVTNPAVRFGAGEMCLPGSFRLCVNTYQAAQPLAPWALKNLGRTALLTGDDDNEGNEEADFFANSFERAGGTFANRVMVADRTKEMKAVIEAITETKPDFIFASFKNASAVAFLKALRSAPPSTKKPVIGPESLTAFPHTLKELGEAALGVKTLTALGDTKHFASTIKRQMGADVTDIAKAAEGYDIAAAVCGALGANSREREVIKSIKTIEEMEITGPRGKVRFDKNHEPVFEMSVQEWQRSGQSFKQKIVTGLGPCQTPDFGCGRIGFPRRPESEVPDEEPVWQDKED
jgi:ABC-type branched-subunit amino acid transport system substrate-binding protein